MWARRSKAAGGGGGGGGISLASLAAAKAADPSASAGAKTLASLVARTTLAANAVAANAARASLAEGKSSPALASVLPRLSGGGGAAASLLPIKLPAPQSPLMAKLLGGAAPPAAPATPPPPPRTSKPAHPTRLLELPPVPILRFVLMAPLVVVWTVGTTWLLTLAFFAHAVLCTPDALVAALHALLLLRRFGPLGKVLLAALAALLAVVAIPLATAAGALVGALYGGFVGGRYLCAGGSPDFVSAPLHVLVDGVYGGVRRTGDRALRQDAQLRDEYVPLDMLVLSPLIGLAVGVVAMPLCATRLLATAVIETPPAVASAFSSFGSTKRLGLAGKVVMFPIVVALPVVLLCLSPLWGAIAGLIQGWKSGFLWVVDNEPIDFLTAPAERLQMSYRTLFADLDDDELPDGFVPLDALILAPFGALAGAVLGPPTVGIALFASSINPDALGTALAVTRDSKRIGPWARVFLQAGVLLGSFAVLPPSALVVGVAYGLVHGMKVGWNVFARGGPMDCTNEPTKWWRAAVLDPLHDYFAEWQALEDRLTKPDVVIDANPIMLVVAVALGAVGALVFCLAYLLVGLVNVPAMAFSLYRANMRIFERNYKIAEALLGIVLYTIQMVLIPVVVAAVCLYQPLEGLAIGFWRTAHAVIVEASSHHLDGHPLECVLDNLGLSGLLPALDKLGQLLGERFAKRDESVEKWMQRMLKSNENTIRFLSGNDMSPTTKNNWRLARKASLAVVAAASPAATPPTASQPPAAATPPTASHRQPRPRRPPRRLAGRRAAAFCTAAESEHVARKHEPLARSRPLPHHPA